MENKKIAKTLLGIWSQLDDYEKMLGERTITHALCSFNSPMLTERIMDKIIELNVKRHTIRNLKYALDSVINSMDITMQNVLRLCWGGVDIEDTVKDMATKIGLSERSFFRRRDTIIQIIADKLNEMGINYFTWKHLTTKHTWINEAFIREDQPNHRRTPSRQKE